MGCRVGMSTDPHERIQHWKDEEGHTCSMILASGLTYEEALKRERDEAVARSCYHHGGGGYVSGGFWSVYYVSGGTTPLD